MRLARTIPQRRNERPPTAEDRDRGLRVNVVFTSVEETLAAVRAAASLAANLRAIIVVVVPQVVPYPAALDMPPVSSAYLFRRLRAVAAESRIETHIRIYICRDRRAALAAALRPSSLVVLAGRRRWWPTREQRLASELTRLGHHVLLTYSPSGN